MVKYKDFVMKQQVDAFSGFLSTPNLDVRTRLQLHKLGLEINKELAIFSNFHKELTDKKELTESEILAELIKLGDLDSGIQECLSEDFVANIQCSNEHFSAIYPFIIKQ